MASVHLDFVPPDVPDLTRLLIFESPTSDGTFVEIERVTGVGAYPTYLSEYTTNAASSESSWFAVDWMDSKGYQVGISEPIQGRTSKLVGAIVRRIQQRDPNINESVAKQESEAAIEQVFHDDPYTIEEDDATYRQKSGLTALAMARVYMVGLVRSGSASKWAAGLVSMTNDATKDTRTNINELMKSAAADLGLNIGVIAQMVVPEIAGGAAEVVEWDISRLIVGVE